MARPGNVALPNLGNGILIVDGDSTRIFQVHISGNNLSGIAITGSATATDVVGNFIGTSLMGGAAVPNIGDGILVQSSGNKIGGPGFGEGNTISGNRQSGIRISGLAASNNTVEGNMIGTDPTGAFAIPNNGSGVLVSNAPNNRIGSATAAAGGNVISGNRSSGINFSLAGSSGGVVYGNKIGTTKSGTLALGNSGNGILINSGATGIVVGGETTLKRNLISANSASGVTIGTNSNNNTISGNYIGTNVSGTSALGNRIAGITVQSSGNLIGGTVQRVGNRIAGNPTGISLTGAGVTQNTIRSNIIGTTSVPNTLRGIQFSGGASGNTVGPSNSISGNESGIRVNDGSINNRITRNSLSSNTNLGIDLFPLAGVNPLDAGDADGGGNLGQNSPTLNNSPLKIGNDLQVNFSVNSLPANAAYPLAIEFYSSDGAGEGRTYLAGTTYTVANFAVGPKTSTFLGAATNLVVGSTKIIALATDANGNTSEFSAEQLLSAPAAIMQASFQTSSEKLDVNKDGVVSPLDVLNVVNAMNSGLVAAGEGEYSSGVTETGRDGRLLNQNTLYDTNGDGVLSPLDVVLVVNRLQQSTQTSAVPEIEHEKLGQEANDQALEELSLEGALSALALDFV